MTLQPTNSHLATTFAPCPLRVHCIFGVHFITVLYMWLDIRYSAGYKELMAFLKHVTKTPIARKLCVQIGHVSEGTQDSHLTQQICLNACMSDPLGILRSLSQNPYIKEERQDINKCIGPLHWIYRLRNHCESLSYWQRIWDGHIAHNKFIKCIYWHTQTPTWLYKMLQKCNGHGTAQQ